MFEFEHRTALLGFKTNLTQKRFAEKVIPTLPRGIKNRNITIQNRQRKTLAGSWSMLNQ